jgi:3-deoxy-D-manno-octulosonate 8-phosphate phosphatase (KDO 8-P phosphatase)
VTTFQSGFCISTICLKRALFNLAVKRISTTVRQKASRVRVLLLDVDGVLTDGGIFIDDRGIETKRFDVRDGQGITLLRRAGIDVGFITGRSSTIVRIRARELGVGILYQGVQNKAETYQRIKRKSSLADAHIGYVGDDLADVPILRHVGLAIVVQDARDVVRPYADYITQAKGGEGAVREVCELILKAQGHWDAFTRPY